MELKKLCKIQPQQWINFVTLLKPLEKQGVINIYKSEICQDINNGVAILFADIQNLIGKNITFDILNPMKFIKLFKLLESKDKDVVIYEDEKEEIFIITNDQIKLFLPKQIENISISKRKPDFMRINQAGNPLRLDKNHKKEIDMLVRSDNVDYIDLLIKDEQLIGFEVKETGIYLFPGYTGSIITKQSADTILKSLAFMIFPGEEFELHLGQNDSGDYSLVTKINTGFLNAQLIENLEINDVNNFNLI